MAIEVENRPQDLDPSALGTQQYWDDAYTREISNFADNPEDEGTIWFEDSGAEERMLEYLETLELPNDHADEAALVSREDLSILDLGTGNGHMLFALRDEQWAARLVGIDYSLKSVELARGIQQARGVERVSFHQCDILNATNEDCKEWLPSGGFDIALDKGTFDAISLSDAVDASGARVFEAYPRAVRRLIRPGGVLLITSCNWSEDELRSWFERGSFEYHATIKFPSFTFGGVKGQTVSSVCFRAVG